MKKYGSRLGAKALPIIGALAWGYDGVALLGLLMQWGVIQQFKAIAKTGSGVMIYNIDTNARRGSYISSPVIKSWNPPYPVNPTKTGYRIARAEYF